MLVPILFITFPSEVIASAPTMTKSISFIIERAAESTISVVFMPSLINSLAVILP